jgi:hypothetical protein
MFIVLGLGKFTPEALVDDFVGIVTSFLAVFGGTPRGVFWVEVTWLQ